MAEESRPFYWTAVSPNRSDSAPSGWYQWTERGLIYLGETILEPMEPKEAVSDGDTE